MIDSPGHADFGTEVTRSLSSVQGAILLFDAAQGVQAQSLSVYEKARSMENVKSILPILTKVDLAAAKPLDVALGISDLFGFDPDAVLLTSARSRVGIHPVLEAVCCDIPSPEKMPDDDDDDYYHGLARDKSKRSVVRAKVVDSWFEPLRGVICLVQILSGHLEEGDRISIVEPRAHSLSHSDESEGDGGNNGSRKKRNSNHAFSTKDSYSIQDIGLVLPKRVRTGSLSRGQMGYVIVGLRDPRQARPGTIMILQKDLTKILDMYLPAPPPATTATSAQSVLFASVHPMEGNGFDELAAAVDRLALNDTGLEIHRTSGASNTSSEAGGPYLGPGLRVGFQGLLHVEVFQQRLFDEFNIEAIVTPPKVSCIVIVSIIYFL